MNRRTYILLGLLILGICILVFFKNSYGTRVPQRPEAIIKLGPFAISHRDIEPRKLAFDRPLFVGETVAIQSISNICILKLEAVQIDRINVKILCTNGCSLDTWLTSDMDRFCNVRLLWSFRDPKSVFLYGDPVLDIPGGLPYRIAYPVKDNTPNAISNEALDWRTEP